MSERMWLKKQLNSKDTWEDRNPWGCLLSPKMRQGEAVSVRHCPATGHWHPHVGWHCYPTGPAMRKELLNLDVDRCTFNSTRTRAEAVPRICRTHVNKWFLGGGTSTVTAAKNMDKFTWQLLMTQKKTWISVQHLSVIVVYKCSKALSWM